MTQKVPYAMVADTTFADIASAATVDLDTAAGSMGRVTGVVGITAITLSADKFVWVQFTGILTITHNGGSLILPGSANITTAAGDWALFARINGIVTCVFYSRASGAAIAVTAGSMPVGSVVQVVNVQSAAVATGTTVLPYDDTIPQNTEGDQYMSLAITPKSATNKLKIDIVLEVAHSVASTLMSAALFQDTTANALAAIVGTQAANINQPQNIKLTYFMTAGTVSATTFKVRAGGSGAGTTTFNGSNAARIFGGVMASSITITEIVA